MQRNQNTAWILKKLQGPPACGGTCVDTVLRGSQRPCQTCEVVLCLRCHALGVLNRVVTWGDFSLKELVQWFCDKDMQLKKERGWARVIALNQRRDDELRWEREREKGCFKSGSILKLERSLMKDRVSSVRKRSQRCLFLNRRALWLTSVVIWELEKQVSGSRGTLWHRKLMSIT